MGVEILSKEGCQYCDLTVDLCKEYRLEYKKTLVEKDELKQEILFLRRQLKMEDDEDVES